MEKEVTINPKKAADREREDKVHVKFTTANWEEYERLREEYNFTSDSAAARCFINLGMRSFVANHPTKETTNQTQEGGPQISDFVPDGEEDSIHMFDELPEVIRENVVDIVDEDPEISRDGNKVYK